ncbi:hypothetical protein L7D48_10690 [Streptomyces sp. S1A]|uniref:hypothetical protein n=1 Tax=Streptomyces sp. ICN903 TaxID=2964654 RepID=UPI001EDAE94B|nr:hypothetical protein [Streptomyces sp. ICN903]MCG3041022.1 hypothetical protein [Streptomyces sp. ICN903]
MSDSRREKAVKGAKIRNSVLASVVSLAVVGGVIYLLGGGEADGEGGEGLCGGNLSVAEVARLGSGGGGDYDSSLVEIREDLGDSGRESSDEDDVILRCGIWMGMQNLAEIEVFAAWEFGPYQGRRVPPDWYAEESPLGSGVVGWTDGKRAEVWLPEECSAVFKSGGKPIQVQLELKNSGHGGPHVSGGEHQFMAEIATSYAKNLAEGKGCDSPDFKVTKGLSRSSAVEDLPGGDQCNIPGFNSLRVGASREGVRQRTVGRMGGDWSCALIRGDGENPHVLSAFAVTSNDRVISRYKDSRKESSEYFHTELFSCGAKEVLAQTTHAGVDEENHSEHEVKSHEYAKEKLLSAEDLHEGFVEALRERLGCSS